MKLTLTTLLLPLLLLQQTPDPELEQMRAEAKAERERFWYVQSTRPVREDGPLRIENISDEEVRQIVAVMSEQYPGAIVNIGGVTSGCPCEDGVSCTAQVWVVASTGNRSDGILLSSINDEWQIGPVQDWWLRYDSLMSMMMAALRDRKSSRSDAWQFQERLNQLQLEFPACSANERAVSWKSS